MALKRVDSIWGAPGTALLPKSLRLCWADEALPGWVVEELKLAPGSSFAALDGTMWNGALAELSERVRNFVLNLMSGRRAEIRALNVFTEAWPYWLDGRDLPFSTRTRNCLVFAGLISDPEQLSNVTFGRLFDIRSMGVISILEFGCVAEGAFERARTAQEGVSPFDDDELLTLITEPWAEQIGPMDPRFVDLLPPAPYATIFEALDSLTSSPGSDGRLLEQLAQAVPELRVRVAQIKALPLERQLVTFLRAASGFEGERLSALVDRLGWNGSPAITLEEAGKRLGITRERVRQLQERVLGRLKEIPFPVYMPGLDRAVQLLREMSPIALSEAAELIKKSGVSENRFDPSSIISAAETCGRKPPIRLQSAGKRSIVATVEIPNVDEIVRVAYRQAQASGASNVGEVVAELNAREISVDDTTVGHALREFSDAVLVEGEWFCRRPENAERDRLRNVTRKMLSVAAPIELGLLREGVRREYRYRGHRGVKTWPLIVPPRSVLRGYYEIHPEFAIDENDYINSIAPLDYRTELALNDMILVDALRSSPACVLDRASLWSECARRSMNVNTFNLYLTYSPAIVHLGTDIWSLRGVRVDPAAVEAVRVLNALRPRERRVLDHGWTPDGHLWVAVRLRAAHSGSLVTGIPGAIKRFLAGREFTVSDDDGIPHGAVKINEEGNSYGFGAFLRQRGADEGDILIAEFNLESGAALLRLADDEVLEEMSPGA